MSELREVFAQNYLVCGLQSEAIEKVVEMAVVETHLAGEQLIRRGEKSGDLYVIISGRVNIVTADNDKLGEACAGSVLGEMALIDDRPRSADAICQGLTRVARIPAKELRTFMGTNRDIGFMILANLARVLCGRLRIADERIDHLMGKPADAWEHAY
jgi:CRP/FNR family transcriptional regulator